MLAWYVHCRVAYSGRRPETGAFGQKHLPLPCPLWPVCLLRLSFKNMLDSCLPPVTVNLLIADSVSSPWGLCEKSADANMYIEH